MSTAVLPYTVKPHPVTGIYNGKFSTWLFLASEVMMFGAFFSSYVLLRISAPAQGPAAWPSHGETHLNWMIGAFNTLVLILSSVTMVMAWASLKMNNFANGRKYLAATLALAVTFLLVKLIFEYVPHWRDGYTTTHSVFFGLYYTMTGLHGLHVLGGILVIGYFIGPGNLLWRQDPEHYTNRIECTGLYWHFVDLVWIFLFPTFYLL
jgi:heme/copper-type cytochrome/quinol oxidase subunit 3